MPSHFSDIGFDFESQNDFERLALQTCEKGQPFRTRDGTYISWSPGGGIELWAHLDKDNELIGLNPHFRRNARMRVGIVNEIKRPDGTVLDVGYYGWANPPKSTVEHGDFPFVFDVPNCKILEPRLGSVVVVQLAAFAHELASYRSAEEFARSQAEGFAFASKSFFCPSLFTPAEVEAQHPPAEAIFTGHVLETSLITNPITGSDFCWAHVSTLGGEVDVVADPVLLNDVVVKGGVVKGLFWLSGVVIAS
jgi:hypothetical protein